MVDFEVVFAFLASSPAAHIPREDRLLLLLPLSLPVRAVLSPVAVTGQVSFAILCVLLLLLLLLLLLSLPLRADISPVADVARVSFAILETVHL